MVIAFLLCFLIILAICGVCFLLFVYFRFNPEIVFSAEEKDFLNDLIEPFDADNGLCAVVKCSPERTNNKKLLENIDQMIDYAQYLLSKKAIRFVPEDQSDK